MRFLAVLFVVGILLLQWPLWFGKGSWLKVWQLQTQIEEQAAQNAKSRLHNQSMYAEVQDLKSGTDAIEERARNEIGMVRQDEIFYQIFDASKTAEPRSVP